MKFTFFKPIILIAFIGCCFFSCSSDLDFDQVDDFNTQPVFNANLAYFNKDASDFISDGSEIPISSYPANVDFLKKSFIQENLIKTEFYFRIKNTIPRDYAINFTFLNANGTPIYNIRMNVAAYNGTEVIVENTVTVPDINILKNTSEMVFTVRMFSGQPITAATPGRIEFSSSATVYFDIR